jgi:hypothetical protein
MDGLIPCGEYRWVWAGGLNTSESPMYTWSPFYGYRRKYIGGMVKRTMTQILVKSLGDLRWINVSMDDIRMVT